MPFIFFLSINLYDTDKNNYLQVNNSVSWCSYTTLRYISPLSRSLIIISCRVMILDTRISEYLTIKSKLQFTIY